MVAVRRRFDSGRVLETSKKKTGKKGEKGNFIGFETDHGNEVNLTNVVEI